MQSYSLRAKVATVVGSLIILATSAGYALALPSTIFSDGFESNSLSVWDEHSGQWGTNLISGVLVHSGNRAAVAQGNTGASPDNLRKDVSTAGYTNINFNYWYRVTAALSGPDYLKAQYSIDGGSNWVTLATYANVSAGAWTSASFTLPATANNNPNLEVRFVANFNGPLDAVRIDDVSVNGDAVTSTSNTVVIHASDLDNTSSNPATVRADGLNKWFQYNDTNDTIDNTLGSFVSGPASAPAGTGSIQFTLGASPKNRDNIATYQFAGTPLSAITTMSFSAYSHSGVAGLTESPFLNFNVDFSGSGTSFQKRLVYVPSANGPVPQDTWNTFDTINAGAGLWNYSGATWPAGLVSNGSIPGTTARTWFAILADYPNARVLPTDSWLGVRVGEPGPTNYVGNVDKFVIGTLVGTDLTTTTFDFEPIAAPVCDGSTTFDTFGLGTVNGQGGWAVTNPSFDQNIVSNTYGYPTFGCQTLRVSDSYTSGTFGDQIFSPSIANEAGELSAANDGQSGGTRQNHFEAQFDIASAQPLGVQPGLHLSVSPDRGDGARMSYLRFEDQSDGVHVFFDDFFNHDFREVEIAGTGAATSTLNRAVPHTIKFSMDFVDGAQNDVVKIYIDGSLIYTGTSWEDYFREVEGNPTRTVDSLLFRESGTADVDNAGKGFLVDNFNLASSENTGSLQITKYVCPIGTTVNRDDNGVTGEAPAGCVPQEGTHFAYAHGTQGDAGAPYDDFSNPLTQTDTTDNNGVVTVSNLPATGRYIVFETDGTGAKLADSDLLGLYCTGDADPNPNHNDNGDITFVPANDTVKCVAYDPLPPDTSVDMPVHVSPADNTVTTTAAQTEIQWTDVTDPSTPVTYDYEVSNSSDVNGDTSFVTPLDIGAAGTGLTVSQIETPNTPEGSYYWHVRAVDGVGNKSPWTAPWHITIDNSAPPAPTSFKVHIFKYLDNGEEDAQIPNEFEGPQFPMIAIYSIAGLATNLNPGDPFALGDGGGVGGSDDGLLYAANTVPLAAGDQYGTHEVIGGDSPVVDQESCSTGKYYLEGYKVGTTLEGANEAAITTDSPFFSNIESDEYVIVVNHACDTVTEPATVGVHIFKFVDGEQATAENADSSVFSMQTTFNSPNYGGLNSNVPFTLSPTGWGGTDSAYEASYVGGAAGDSYTANEVTGGDVVGASCSDGKPFALVGYSSGNTLEDAIANGNGEEGSPSLVAPSFENLQDDNHYVIVWNEKCVTTPEEPETGSLIIVKHTIGGNGSFNFTLSGETSTSTSLDTGESNWATSTPITINTGSTTVSEVAQSGWNLTDVTCEYDNEETGNATAGGEEINIDNGDQVTCTFTNTSTEEGGGGDSSADLSVTKTVDNATPNLNDQVIYTITVTNNGPDAATAVSLSDLLPSGLTYVSDNASVGSYATSTGIWTIGTLASGATSTLSIAATVNSDDTNGEVITNTATVSSETSDSNSGNNSATRSVTVTVPVETPSQPTPSFTSGGGGNGPISGSFGASFGGGSVLGASTSTVPDTSTLSCSTPLLTQYMRIGKPNDASQVKLLQTFLNGEVGSHIPVTGFFGIMTDAAVRAFQLKYASEVLSPWGLTQPTGYVYKTTEWKINMINCSTLNAPVPDVSHG